MSGPAQPEKPMKVAHLITGLSVGGAEMMLWKLVSRLDRRRFEPLVISLTDDGPLAERIRALNIPVYVLDHDRSRPDLRAFVELVNLLRRERPAILQSWLYHSDFLGIAAAKLAGVPIVAWNLRGSAIRPEDSSSLLAMVLRGLAWVSRIPDAVVVNSEAGKAAHLALGYRPRRWVLIPNGFDTDAFAPSEVARQEVRRELGLDSETVVIGLVARFDPLKDPANFVRAAAILLEQCPRVRFLMIGRGMDASNRRLTDWISEAGITGAVHLLGERSDVSRLAASLDIATSTSYSEGFPNAIGEAMAAGIPCVVTDAGDSASIVGPTGRVVAPSDPVAVAAAWKELIDMGPDRRRALGAVARERIEDRFGLGEVVRRYEDLYASLASAKHLSPPPRPEV